MSSRTPRDERNGDPRDERDPREPGDPRDERDPREPGDPLDASQISEAARAVFDRYRRFKIQIVIAVAVMAVVTISSSIYIVHSNREVVRAQSRGQLSLICAIAAEGKVNAESLGTFATRFGAVPPPIPGLPHECGGVDPVFIGSNGADVIDGTSDPDWINGEGGGDTLHARGGGDTIIGYSGNDTLYGGKGTDYLYGGEGTDALFGGGDSRTDHLDGGPGTDTCYARSNDLVSNCEHIVRVVS